MAKIMVFQHVPYEPLGTLDPLLRAHKHRIRYVNFGREPTAKPSITGYDALIILGGPMNIGQEKHYPHLETEKQVIVEAHKQGIPVLGICLGAQLIASAFGAEVKPAKEREVGWYQLQPTDSGNKDALIQYFSPSANLFQWHEYTFDLPEQGIHLVEGEGCGNQAFRIGENIYGFQFHLEANLALIKRWLHLPQHQAELGLDKAKQRIDDIWKETLYSIDDSLVLSQRVFSAFLKKLPKVKRQTILPHRQFGG